MGNISHLGFENSGDACIKSGFIKNDNYFIVKVASGGFGYGSSGLMNIFSQKTGKLEGILLDEGYLTDLRTAIASIIGLNLFSPKKITSIGILGTGIQAK